MSVNGLADCNNFFVSCERVFLQFYTDMSNRVMQVQRM